MKLVANQTEMEINNGKVFFAMIILGYLHINIPLRQKKEKTNRVHFTTSFIHIDSTSGEMQSQISCPHQIQFVIDMYYLVYFFLSVKF